MLHEPCRTVGRLSTLLHAVQHGGVSCMGITNPPLALSGHARQFRAETLCPNLQWTETRVSIKTTPQILCAPCAQCPPHIMQ